MNLEEIEHSNRRELSNFKSSINTYLKKWPWILGCVAVFLIFAKFYSNSKVDLYRVESTVQVNKTNQIEDPSQLILGRSIYGRNNGKISDEAIVFKSFPLIRKTLIDLKFDVSYFLINGFRNVEIYDESPVVLNFNREDASNIPYGSNFELRLKEQSFIIKAEKQKSGDDFEEEFRYGETIEFNGFNFQLDKSDNFDQFVSFEQSYLISLNSIDKISYAYKSRLNFEEIEPFSSMITMSMKTSVPEKSIAFINTLVQHYIDQNLEDKNTIARNTIDFIDSQLEIISDSLDKRESNLEDFKSDKQITNMSLEGQVLVDKLTEIEAERSQYEVIQQYYDYLKSNLVSNEEPDLTHLIAPSAFGIEDDIINDLVRSLIELNLTKSQLIEAGNTKSPLLAQIEVRNKELIKTLKESIDNLSSANKIVLSTLNERISRINLSASNLPSSERKLVNLSRLLKLNENIYLFLMEKRSSAAITMSSNTPDCKVIEPAMLNPMRPISPVRRMIYIVAVLLGTFIPLIVLILYDFLDDTIRSKYDVSSITSIPILGLLPKAKFNNLSDLVRSPKSSIAESFRMVRTNLTFFQQQEHPFIISVTSSIPKEGKTFCAINLSFVLASAGHKVLLIGCDLRKPRIHEYLKVDSIPGLSNYLAGELLINEIIQKTEISNLNFIPSGSIPPNPSELLSTDRMKKLLGELKETHDYIVLDTPPIGLVADALILAEMSDLNLFVVKEKYSKKEFLERLNELNANGKLKNAGILINDVKDQGSKNYGYYEESNENLQSKVGNFFSKS